MRKRRGRRRGVCNAVYAPGMKVLDISDPQVAVYFADDKEYSYHHRILLYRIGAAKWVTLTPDCEFAVHDFGEEDIVVLERGSDFPPEVQGSCYTFDPLDLSELASFRRRAKLHAVILGGQRHRRQQLLRGPG